MKLIEESEYSESDLNWHMIYNVGEGIKSLLTEYVDNQKIPEGSSIVLMVYLKNKSDSIEQNQAIN